MRGPGGFEEGTGFRRIRRMRSSAGKRMDKPYIITDEVLERFRKHIHAMAKLLLDPRLESVVGASDVTQMTIIKAYEGREKCRARSEAQVAAWLRTILTNTVKNEIRNARRGRRDIARNVPIQDISDKSSGLCERVLVARGSSPSSRLEKEELLLALLQALTALAWLEQKVLTLQHWHNWSIDEIGTHIGKPPTSVARLLRRGLERMRIQLKDLGERP